MNYGDAPDAAPSGYRLGPNPAVTANFPKTFNSQNVRITGNRGITHTNAAPSLQFFNEFDREPDALVVDSDVSDDGQPTLTINRLGAGGGIAVTVRGSGADDGEMVTGFLNVLVDLNQDGRWSRHVDSGITVTEWVVENFPVSIPSGTDQRINPPGFAFGPNSARTEFWARLSLTTTPITVNDPDGWDGSGPPAGLPDGETEDFFFGCEGALRITYPATSDVFGSRLRTPGVQPIPPGPITGTIRVTNLANQTVTCVFSARTQVGVPLGLGYFYKDVNRAAPEFTTTLVSGGGALRFATDPKNLPPQGLVTITLAAGATENVTFTMTRSPANLGGVLDPARGTPPGSDNRIGRLLFHPLGPCLLRLQKTNDEPIHVEWPQISIELIFAQRAEESRNRPALFGSRFFFKARLVAMSFSRCCCLKVR